MPHRSSHGNTTMLNGKPPKALPDGYDPETLGKQIHSFPNQGSDLPAWLRHLNTVLNVIEITRLKTGLDRLGYQTEWGGEGLRMQKHQHHH